MLSRGDSTDQCLAAVRAAVRRYPENLGLLQLLSAVHLLRGEYDSAYEIGQHLPDKVWERSIDREHEEAMRSPGPLRAIYEGGGLYFIATSCIAGEHHTAAILSFLCGRVAESRQHLAESLTYQKNGSSLITLALVEFSLGQDGVLTHCNQLERRMMGVDLSVLKRKFWRRPQDVKRLMEAWCHIGLRDLGRPGLPDAGDISLALKLFAGLKPSESTAERDAAYSSVMQLVYRNQDLDQVITATKKALTKHPNASRLRALLGYLDILQGNLREAHAAHRQAAEHFWMEALDRKATLLETKSPLRMRVLGGPYDVETSQAYATLTHALALESWLLGVSSSTREWLTHSLEVQASPVTEALQAVMAKEGAGSASNRLTEIRRKYRGLGYEFARNLIVSGPTADKLMHILCSVARAEVGYYPDVPLVASPSSD